MFFYLELFKRHKEECVVKLRFKVFYSDAAAAAAIAADGTFIIQFFT